MPDVRDLAEDAWIGTGGGQKFLSAVFADSEMQFPGSSAAILAGATGRFVPLTANYTLGASDNGKQFRVEGSSAITVTVPASLPEGFNALFFQYGTGVATIAAGAGATKRGSGVSTAQYVFTTAVVVRNVGGTAAEFTLAGGA